MSLSRKHIATEGGNIADLKCWFRYVRMSGEVNVKLLELFGSGPFCITERTVVLLARIRFV